MARHRIMMYRTIICVLAIGMQPATVSVAAALQAADARAVHPYAPHVDDAARRFAIPEAWIWAVMRAESNGDARAVSRAGAMGLMQIMPATWATIRARYALGNDPFAPRANIMAGAAYLRAMYDRYGSTAAMLAAYNAGPGRYDDYRARGRPLPAETTAYVAQIVPMIGGTTDTRIADAAPRPDPLAWRSAALFVGTASARSEPSAVQPDDTTPASPASDDPLFVRRVSAGRPQ
jgi:soluble lytic murein transglycosylase-like protein